MDAAHEKMLETHLEFLNAWHDSNNEDRMTRADFDSIGLQGAPVVQLDMISGDNRVIRLTNVTPYHDEGGPSDLVAHFTEHYDYVGKNQFRQTTRWDLEWMVMYFDTIATLIYTDNQLSGLPEKEDADNVG